MIRAIMSLYENATSRVNINGHYTGDISIKCSIRQGCPLSSLLYAMILDPFLNLLHTRLRGLKIGTEKRKITCVAYADDVSVIIRDTRDIHTLKIF
jgi:hypothetical protein